jgi:hypothetical protein
MFVVFEFCYLCSYAANGHRDAVFIQPIVPFWPWLASLG